MEVQCDFSVFNVPLDFSPVLTGEVPKLKSELELLIPIEQLQREVNSNRCPVVKVKIKVKVKVKAANSS